MGVSNKILFSSSTKNLVLLRNFIEANASAMGLDEGTTNQIVLSVDEACTNIIKHAHKYDESQKIEVETEFSNEQFKVVLKYRGKAFDPNILHSPDMKDYFKSFKVGGLGVPIMKKFMNKIEFKHKNSDYNYLTLIKSIRR